MRFDANILASLTRIVDEINAIVQNNLGETTESETEGLDPIIAHYSYEQEILTFTISTIFRK